MDHHPTFSSIGPEIWGRSFWEFLDAIVATFPKDNPSLEQKSAVRDLFLSLRYLLPCPTCRKHYNDFVHHHSIDNALVSRRTLVDFYFFLKKDVSSRTNKPFPHTTPDQLWNTIIRQLRLINHPISIQRVQQPSVKTFLSPRLRALQKPSSSTSLKKSFRVPTRIKNVSTATKGCGCSKNK